MRRKKIVVIALLVIGLAACTPDPRNQADADNSRTLTAQEAETQETARQKSLERWELIKSVLVSSMPTLIVCTQIAVIALTIGVSMSFVGTGAGVGWAGFHLGKVAVRAADVKANQIHMDVESRTFPLVLNYVKAGIYTCTNPATGSTLRLDTRNKADAELIKGINALTHDGMIAYEARRSKQPQETAVTTGTLIDTFERMVNHAAVPSDH
jgi:hypothetical protein